MNTRRVKLVAIIDADVVGRTDDLGGIEADMNNLFYNHLPKGDKLVDLVVEDYDHGGGDARRAAYSEE